MRTRKEERFEAEARQLNNRDMYVGELMALFMNSVTVDNLPEQVPAAFVIEELAKHGKVGKITDDYFSIRAAGRPDKYGRPERLSLYGANGRCYFSQLPREDVIVFRANKYEYPIYGYFCKIAEQMAKMDTGIDVNLANSMTSWLLLVKDEAVKATVVAAFDDLRVGLPAVAALKDSGIGEAIENGQNINVPFVADKIKALQMTLWEEALKHCGITTANNFKRERVQTAEVNASVGECIDYIYAMVDTFNQDAEKNGQPERMRFTGYVSENYDNGDEQETKEETPDENPDNQE